MKQKISDFGKVMVRVPLLGEQALAQYANAYEQLAAESTQCADEGLLLSVSQDDVVMESLLISSVDLYVAVRTFNPALKDPRDTRRLADSVFRYIVRSCSRTTPFGTMAGVAMLNIARNTSIQIGGVLSARTHSRVDLGWLYQQTKVVEASARGRENILVRSNSVRIRVGDRLYFQTQGDDDGRRYLEGSISASPLALRILDLADGGSTVENLVETISFEWNGIDQARLYAMIQEMIRRQVLFYEERPFLVASTSDELYASVRLLHSGMGYGGFSQIEALCSEFDRQELGRGSKNLLEAKRFSGSGDKAVRTVPIQVDMEMLHDSGQLGINVVDAVKRLVELLFRMSRYSPSFPHLVSYRAAFLERYGEATRVPILEVLDDRAGLGAPYGYQQPSSSRAVRPDDPDLALMRRRERALLRIAMEASAGKHSVVELQDSDLIDLTLYPDWESRMPMTSEIPFLIVATSHEAINRGDFQVVMSPAGGSPVAGQIMGRFGPILGPSLDELLKQIALCEQSTSEDVILAECVFEPADRRAANVVVRTHGYAWEIPVNANSRKGADRQISLSNLVVCVEEGKFRLYDMRSEREVEVRHTHRLSLHLMPNVVRFMTEVSLDGTAKMPAFGWGNLQDAPYLPRLICGRAILSPAIWNLSRSSLGMHGAVGSFEEFCYALDLWRSKWNVADAVEIVEAHSDLRLLVRLDLQIGRIHLYREFAKLANSLGSVICMQEHLESAWCVGHDGERRALEFVLPVRFSRNQKLTEKDTRVGVPTRDSDHSGTPSRVVFVPGDQWLYLKIYCALSIQDEILQGPIAHLVASMSELKLHTSWFFVRYADPEPHIRLRFQGDAERLSYAMHDLVRPWADVLIERGEVHNIVVDSYRPEIERYGGVDGFKLAEKLFNSDSEAVAKVLSGIGTLPAGNDLIKLAVGTSCRYLNGFADSMQGKLQIVDYGLSHPRQPGTKESRRIAVEWARACLEGQVEAHQGLFGDQEDDVLSELEFAAGQCARVWRQLESEGRLSVAADSVMTSMLHMHLNRLVGGDRSVEAHVRYAFSRACRSLMSRTPS